MDSAAVHDPKSFHGGESIGFIIKVMESMIYFAPTLDGALLYPIIGGPYIKSKFNPVTNSGHEVWVWPWRNGIAAMVDWPESRISYNTVYRRWQILR